MHTKEDTVWKEFGKNDITHSTAHYLMAIQQLHDTQGYARLSDVAKKLNISKGSLSTSLKPLIRKKLIVEDENKHLSLSKTGQEHALRIKNTYFVVKHFLTDILKIDENIAEIDACKIEHLLSEESSTELLKLVKVLEKDASTLASLHQSISTNKSCSTKGCRKCTASPNHFCLADSPHEH
jgi:DtxR family Mn-dependent transcriptional regulator